MSDVVARVLEIWEYVPTSQTYILRDKIATIDILKYTYVDRAGTQISELEINLKPLAKYTKYVPQTKTAINSLQPIIIKAQRYTNGIPKSDYEVLIMGREFNENEEENLVRFTGMCFKKIEENKIITTNKDFSHIFEEDSPDEQTEAKDLPADFAKYIRNTSIKNVLTDLYNSAILAPKVISYGAIGAVDNTRKVKGMGTVTITYAPTTAYNVRLDQIPLLEAKENLYSRMPKELETRFNTDSGKINVIVQEGKTIDKAIIRKFSEIVASDFGYQQQINYVASHGNANVIHTEKDIKNIDFCSYEKVEDYSFIAGNNQAYLITPTKTELKKGLQEAKEYLKLNIRDIFALMRAGDFFEFKEKMYRALQIQEEFETDSTIGYDVELEEV